MEFDIYISDAEGLKAEIIPDTGNPVWSSVFLRFINGKGDAFENWWHWSIDAKELHTGYNHMRIPTSSIPSTHLTDLAQILMYQENNGAAISPVNNYFIGAVNFCGVNTAAKMDGVYSDNMLFGQNKPIRVTGTGTPGALVKTELTAEKDNRIVRSGECTIPENGIWEIEMQGLPASFDTYTLNFYINGSSDPEKSVKNVIIGELYLASGQSNMAFRMWETPEGADWFNNNTYDRNGNPNIRVLSSGDTYWDGADVPYEPDRNAVETYWAVGNTRDFYDVSAVAYYFADRLQQKLGIPVGVMDASLGGSSIFSWISREAIESDDVLLDYLKNSDRYFDKSNWQTEHSLNNAQQKMTSLYNIKTAPLSSMEISGVIWYQGCNEVGIADGVYAEALKVLRDCYEDTFSYDDGKLPFILTELHAYGFTDPTLPQMWDQMTAAAENNEKMGAVTIYDLPSDWDYSGYTPGGWGIADPIHPYTKKPVGIRLAEAMYAMVYDGSYGESTAPVWNGTKTVDGKYVYLDFDHVGSSLATPDGVTLYGFSVANAKGVFVNAKAEIVDENTVKVWSDVTENPVDVSYCYDNLSVTSNLYGTQNGEVFLPVAPFITTNDPETVHAQNNSWYEVDDQKLTHFVGTKFGEYNSWTADGAAAQIINDVKASGEGALKLGYTNDADTFYAAPTLTGENEERFTDLNYNYSFYDRIDFKVKNEGAEITLNKLAFCSDGTWYYANIDKSLPSDSGWVSVTANLNRLTDDKGASYNNSGKLCSVTEIRVYFTKTSGEGAVYIDEFSLGNESYGAYKEVPSPVKTASVTDMGVSISYGAVTNTAYIGDLYLMHNSDGADASASDYFEFDFYINDYDEVKRLSGLGYSFAMWIASDPSNRFASRCSFGISDMITKTGWNHIRVKLSDITYKEDGFSFANMYYFYITCNNAAGERCDTSLYVKLSNFSHTVHAGDINGDGNINVLDLIRYKKVMLSDTEDYDALALDVDRSGKAEHAADFISLRKLLFELF